MERFTGKVTGPNSCGHAVPVTFAMDFVFRMTDRDYLQFQALLDRLYEYEETGLTPEEIKILASGACEKAAKLVEVLPQLVQAVVENLPQLVQAVVENLPQLVQAVVENLPQLVEQAVNKIAGEIQEGQA